MLPRLYAILDAELLERRSLGLASTAAELAGAGVRLLQFRDKRGDLGAMLRDAREIAGAVAGSGCLLILNDQAGLVEPSGFDGVHVGQGDVSAEAAREVIGPGRLLGVSTHTEMQMRAAASGPADYVAVGPVFGTTSKANAEPLVGLAGVRAARLLTDKPLVAIGGISAESVGPVIAAGADTVAVIGALYMPGRGVGEGVGALLQALGE